jgi:tetratricopeptide (TPR) repeat protein
LRRAATFYRRALAADAAHVESAVRYARALGPLGEHAEAATELRRIATPEDTVLAYYSQLFLGVEEEALGRHDAARKAYEQALVRFPRAQAPHLALSQLLHRAGDRVAARDALAPLLTASLTEMAEEPWWLYRTWPGRHAPELVAAVYRAIYPDGAP